jgi:transcription antitermination factor NusG
MHRLPSHYKEIKPELFKTYRWYVAFVGNMRHVISANISLTEEKIDHIIWAPCFQEYRKDHSDFVLMDRLLYAGYIFIGLKNQMDFVSANIKLLASRKGYLLGTSHTCLSGEELDKVYQLASTFYEVPRMMFNVREGDTISIKSGIFSGLFGKVKEVRTDGRLIIQAFFMNRDVEINLSILDIQSLGDNAFYEEDLFH